MCNVQSALLFVKSCTLRRKSLNPLSIYFCISFVCLFYYVRFACEQSYEYALFFINIHPLMNQKELQDFSYSLSYLTNEQLETKLSEFFPRVLDSLDSPSTIRDATEIIQYIKGRFRQSEVHLECTDQI